MLRDGVAEERELGVPWALRQDYEPRVQLRVCAESHEVGVVVRDEHELLADGQREQLVVRHAKPTSVTGACRLMPEVVGTTDERRGQALVDPELHVPRVMWRLGSGRLAPVSHGAGGRPRRGLA